MPASRSRRTTLVALLGLLPTLAFAAASQQRTEEFTLDNGLKLVELAPNVSKEMVLAATGCELDVSAV